MTTFPEDRANPDVTRFPMQYTDAEMILRGHVPGHDGLVDVAIGRVVFKSPDDSAIIQDRRDASPITASNLKVVRDETVWWVEIRGQIIPGDDPSGPLYRLEFHPEAQA